MPEPTPYRDSSGRTLADYPRPSVAVDVAVLTVPEGGELSVLLTLTNDAVRGGEPEWRLPGTFLREGETLADAVLRSLLEKAGVSGLHPRQLHVFDRPDRDDRGWVLSVAHLDVVRADRIPLIERTQLEAITELPPLQFDHAEIVVAAVARLRADYAAAPDPAELLGLAFTMRELRAVHEAVAGEHLQPDTFRRRVLDALVATGETVSVGRGRPAEVFRRVKPGR